MNLAAIPSPTTAVWHLGPIPIRAYALCIVAGIIAACAVTEVRMRRRGAPPWAVLDIAVWAVPFGIIGARIYHVITTPDKYFGAEGNLLDAIMIWKGGLGIWGAVAGGALGAWIAARQLGIPLTFVADALAPGLPIAQAIGRLGNWFNNELYGGRTELPWGLKVYKIDPGTGRAEMDNGNPVPAKPYLTHPTFLYELIWNLGVALLVWQVDKRFKLGKGRAFALYVMGYTAGRAWIEAMRTDEAVNVVGLRLNVWVSIFVFLGALAYFLRKRGPQEYLVPEGERFRATTEEEFHAYQASAGTDGADTDGASEMEQTAAHTAAKPDPERADPDTGEPDAQKPDVPEPGARDAGAGDAGAGDADAGDADARDADGAGVGDAEPVEAKSRDDR